MNDKTDIYKVEIIALQAICKSSALNSEWWPLQVQLLREAAYVAAAENSLSVRDRQIGAKLDQYIKALTALHATMVRSDTMIGEVRTNQGQDWANRMSVSPVLKERYFSADGSHIFHVCVRAAAQTAQNEVKDAVRLLSTNCRDYDLDESSWKKDITEKDDLEKVLQTAASTLNILKGGLVKNNIETLKQAGWICVLSCLASGRLAMKVLMVRLH